MIAYARKFLVF